MVLPAALTFAGDTQSARAGEEINWQVLSSGGTKGISTNYILNGTVSQTAVDEGLSTNYIIRHGFWQDFGEEIIVCDCEPGEADGIPPINILDIVYLINYKYKGGPIPTPYEFCNGDPNCDCDVNILDIVYVINYKYKSGSAPCTCEDWLTACGPPLRK
jgi:hypothetical protein